MLSFAGRQAGELPPPNSEPAVSTQLPARSSPGLAVLECLDSEQLETITSRLTLACAGLRFKIGFEQQLEDARRRHGLVDLRRQNQGWDAAAMDYRAVVSPDVVFALREQAPCGPEDHLFSTVHQITECWLRIAHHYLAEAHTLAQGSRFADAAAAMSNACDVLPLAVQVGQLLDQMVLVDYHPLRVRLRDGSGAQSSAARGLGPALQKAAAVLWEALESLQVSVLDVLQRPNEHAELYQYLSALKCAGKRVQSFLFHHYLLTLGVLGTHSLGSLGYEIRELAERAVQPLFPEINQAHHDYVMLTNFEHGESSGSIVYRNELNYGHSPYLDPAIPAQLSGCPNALVEAQVLAYFRAIEERDADAWVGLFDPARGELHDVPGTRPYLGQRRLRVFINSMFRAFREMHGTCSVPHIQGNLASVDWHFDAVSYHGVPSTLDGREEFVFDDAGRILKAVAHWQPSAVAQQWNADARERQAGERSPIRQHSYIASLAPGGPQASSVERGRGRG